jgi:hypothetical protein
MARKRDQAPPLPFAAAIGERLKALGWRQVGDGWRCPKDRIVVTEEEAIRLEERRGRWEGQR